MTIIKQNITFAIPTFNSQKVIKESVKSIIETNFILGDEIILVDDCSTDNTRAIIKDLADHYSGIRIIHHLINKGNGLAGENTAIEHAKNELIYVLDHDNVLAPNSIKPLKDYLLKCNADAASFQEVRYFKYNDEPTNTTHKWIYKEGVLTLADALTGPYWPGPSGNYLFTKESWRKAGRANEFVHPAIDCWAFAIKQLITGTKMVILPESFYYHRYGNDSQWITSSKNGNLSLASLAVIVPYLDLFKDEDVEYLMSRKGRYNWGNNLESHPIRLKSGEVGIKGSVKYLTIQPPKLPTLSTRFKIAIERLFNN